MAQRAFHDGICHSQTKGELNKWITSLYFKNKSANNIRIYGDKAYIFCDEILVTVLQVPSYLRNNLKMMINKDE